MGYAINWVVRLEGIDESGRVVETFEIGEHKSWGSGSARVSVVLMSEIAASVVYRLKMSLRGISPMIWHRLLAQEEMTLFGLHRAIQVVFGWQDYHLHAFKLHSCNYSTIRAGERHRDAAGLGIRLGDLQLRVRQRILYEYDFGELWEHEIRVEAILGRDAGKVYPICVGGARAGPPEDIGGPMGYYALLDQPPTTVRSVTKMPATMVTDCSTTIPNASIGAR